jgi:hypothetical protein
MTEGSDALERAWLHLAGAVQARDSYWPSPDPASVERRIARLARELCAELDRVQPRSREALSEAAAEQEHRRGRRRAAESADATTPCFSADVARLVAEAQVLAGQWCASQPGDERACEARARLRLALRCAPDMVEARVALAELSLRHAWAGARELIASAARAGVAGEQRERAAKRARGGRRRDAGAGAVSDAAWRERQVAAKAQAMYTCALVELSGGSPRSADALLHELGFRLRLSDAVFASPDSAAAAAAVAARGKAEARARLRLPVSVLDGALCAGELELLQRCFGPRSAYWSAQQYEHPSCGYVSHVVSASARARHCVERVVLERLLPLAAEARRAWSGSSSRPLAYCEWWAHRRDAMGGHQLHYDSDEGSLKRGLGLKHPEVSVVLYLRAGLAGSPTLVTSQRFGEVSLDDDDDDENQEELADVCGELCFPRDNRLLMFDGSLLHGVVPRPGRSETVRGDQSARGELDDSRVTLMVGFWADDVTRVPYQEGLRPQANMEVPHGGVSPEWARAPGFRLDEWPRDSSSKSNGNKSKDNDKKAAHARPSAGSTVHVPHVWQRIGIEPRQNADEALEQAASMFVAKYFLRSPAELDAETALYAFPSWPSLEQLTTRLMGCEQDHHQRSGGEEEEEEEQQQEAEGESEEESEERMGMQLAFALNSLVRVWGDERDERDERDYEEQEGEPDDENDEIRNQAAQLMLGLCARHERARVILANSRPFRDELRDRIRGSDAMACALAWSITRDPAARGPLLQDGLQACMEDVLLIGEEQEQEQTQEQTQEQEQQQKQKGHGHDARQGHDAEAESDEEDGPVATRHCLAGALAYCEQGRVSRKELVASLAASLRQLAQFEMQSYELWPGFRDDVVEHVDALKQLAAREPALLEAIRADPHIARMLASASAEH